jgi:hypothetical protein
MQFTIAFRASGDFQDEPGVSSNRDMSRKAEAIGTMGTIPIEFEIRGKTGFDALLEAGERKPCGRGVKAVGSSQEMTVGDIGPTVAVVTSFKGSFSD